MFETLAAALPTGDAIPVDGDGLRELLAVRDRLDAALAHALGAFDGEQLWDVDGATSLAGWLVDQARVTKADGWRTAQAAKWLREIPATHTAWEAGRLSGGQIQIIVAHLTLRRLPYYHDAEPLLIAQLAPLSIPDTVVRLRQWA